MAGRITHLTPEQEARFPEFVRKWIDIGLSTAPADRQRAERAIGGLYDLAKLRRPRVIWLPCPISAALSAVSAANSIPSPNKRGAWRTDVAGRINDRRIPRTKGVEPDLRRKRLLAARKYAAGSVPRQAILLGHWDSGEVVRLGISVKENKARGTGKRRKPPRAREDRRARTASDEPRKEDG